MAAASEPGHLFLGLMSGTSMDGIDAALLRFGDRSCETLTARAHPYPAALRDQLLALRDDPGSIGIDQLGRLDTAVGCAFRDAAISLLEESAFEAQDVCAIGSHGQTVRHQPNGEYPFTLQIGDPNIIARGTGITTVADFRRRDLAAGGQGAPLAPAFHRWLFGGDDQPRAVLNLGGFANLTLLPADGSEVSGFDVGPANSLMDAHIRLRKKKPYDRDGAWARRGQVLEALLGRLCADEFFQRAPPKSTGFEHFNLGWLEDRLSGEQLAAQDVQATLMALTVRTIAEALRRHAPDTREVLICGGGVHNTELVRQLTEALAPARLDSTAAAGLDPDWVEAAAFAWLASRTLARLPGNLPAVTAASTPEVLGGVYLCAS